jgi:hypothetical protein
MAVSFPASTKLAFSGKKLSPGLFSVSLDQFMVTPSSPSGVLSMEICKKLNSRDGKWTCVNPLAYAYTEESKSFCPPIALIRVKSHSLTYVDAVSAATGVKEILADAGFSEIEVVFIDSVVTRSGAGPKLMALDPEDDAVPQLRKPFTSSLGLSIAPLKYSQFGGTGGLHLRLSKDDDRVVVLTYAHIARSPPAFPNTQA